MKSFLQFMEACWRGYTAKGLKRKGGRMVPNCVPVSETAAWTRAAGKNPEGGLNARGVASYRAENPGSKLKMAVTTPPSKLKAGSKSAKRRKSVQPERILKAVLMHEAWLRIVQKIQVVN